MLSATEEALIVDLIAHLRSGARPDEAERVRKYRAFSRRVWQAALTFGLTFGEAGGWRGTAIRTADQAEFRAHWKAIANDLPRHVQLVREGIEVLHDEGQPPPPASVQRLAIMLRRAKRVDLEAALLRAWLEATPRGNSEGYEGLISRMFRAEQLATKR